MKRVVIVGGCGHVGLPLGIELALQGYKTLLVDLDSEKVKAVNSGKMPFLEVNGDEKLAMALKENFEATTSLPSSKETTCFIFVAGTPIDEHHNPKLSAVNEVIEEYLPHIGPGDFVMMRSTLFPGTTEFLKEKYFHPGTKIHFAYCPERVAQGYSLVELQKLPQIISAFDQESLDLAAQVFGKIAPSLIVLEPREAEMAKLMINTWRYIEFAISNDFYAMAESHDIDFWKVFNAMKHDYPRAEHYASPGFAAGPCLFKDTMQVSSFMGHKFQMGQAAMYANEGVVDILIEKCKKKMGSIQNKSIGILGMTFKANNDDTRESLSFKLKKMLEFHQAKVLWHDPYLPDSTDLDQVQRNCDLLILGVPHREYSDLKFTENTDVIDMWGFFKKSPVTLYEKKKP